MHLDLRAPVSPIITPAITALLVLTTACMLAPLQVETVARERLFVAALLDDVDGDGAGDIRVEVIDSVRVTRGQQSLIDFNPAGVIVLSGATRQILEVVLPTSGSLLGETPRTPKATAAILKDYPEVGDVQAVVRRSLYGFDWWVDLSTLDTGELILRIDPVELVEQGAAMGRLAVTLVAASDVDSDGYPDFYLLATPLEEKSGAVLLVSGRDGALLAQAEAQQWGTAFPEAAVLCGDVDGDQCADLLIGAPPKSVVMVSGRDLSVLWRGRAPEAWTINDGFGGSLASGVDVTGDGAREVYVGGWSNPASWADRSLREVLCLDGRTGSIVARTQQLEGMPEVLGSLLQADGQQALLILSWTAIEAYGPDLTKLLWRVDLGKLVESAGLALLRPA